MSEHPAQEIAYPGTESQMAQQPRDEMRDYAGGGLLEGKVALVTGGDSGIGRAVCVAFAKEGADVAISYLNEDDDARKTAALVQGAGRRALLLPGNICEQAQWSEIVSRTVEEFGWIDVLVNNAAFQNPVDKPEDLTLEQFRRTFGTNIEATFFVTQAALPHMPEGSSIINTASITGLQGHKQLLDYAVHRISAGCHGRE